MARRSDRSSSNAYRAEGMTLIERRNTFELFRDQAAELFEHAHRLRLAAARRLDGQPPHAHRRHDRQPRLPRRQAPRRKRSDAARRAQGRLHRRLAFNDHHAIWDRARQGPGQAPRHGAAARRLTEGRRTHRRLLGR